MTEPGDTRSAQARAYQWASRIISVSLEMVVPGLIGYWIDQQLGTVAVFTIVGFIGGMCLGMWHLLKIAKSPVEQQVAERRKTRP